MKQLHRAKSVPNPGDLAGPSRLLYLAGSNNDRELAVAIWARFAIQAFEELDPDTQRVLACDEHFEVWEKLEELLHDLASISQGWVEEQTTEGMEWEELKARRRKALGLSA